MTCSSSLSTDVLGMVQAHFSAFKINDKIVPQTFFKNDASKSGVFELCLPLVRGALLQCVVLVSGPSLCTQGFDRLHSRLKLCDSHLGQLWLAHIFVMSALGVWTGPADKHQAHGETHHT